MRSLFQQPGWIAEAGTPYPGAENVAALIETDQNTQRVYELSKTEKLKYQARRKGQEDAEKEEHGLRRMRSITADTITPKRVKWLWDNDGGRIPMGELTLIVGRGGVGKSTLLCTLASWISIGDMRGEHDGTPRDVIYVANEDSHDYTVVPRLIAAGADMRRIHFPEIDFGGRPDRIILPSDCQQIKELALRHNAVAVMLDPLSSNLRGKKNDGDDMRPTMEAIRRMCEEAGIAAIGLGHTRKGQSKDLLEALMGSSEMGNVCRSAMGVMADPDEEGTIVLSQEKNNLGRLDIPGYVYKINSHQFQCAGEIITTAKLAFLRKTDQKVGDMIAESGMTGESKSAMKEAVDFLRDYLMHNPGALKKDIIQAGRSDHSQRTIERAADRLRVIRLRGGFGGGVTWTLPS